MRSVAQVLKGDGNLPLLRRGIEVNRWSNLMPINGDFGFSIGRTHRRDPIHTCACESEPGNCALARRAVTTATCPGFDMPTPRGVANGRAIILSEIRAHTKAVNAHVRILGLGVLLTEHLNNKNMFRVAELTKGY